MSRLNFTATQGGADAFVEAEIQTGLSGQTKNAYKITRISWEFDGAPPRPFSGAAAHQDVELSITRRTKAAMPAITDQDVIFKKHWSLIFQTAVGSNFQNEPVSGIWTPPVVDGTKLDDGIIIVVEDPLYVQLDSTATTLTLAVVGTIEYELITISELNRLTLLTQSLA